MSRRADGYAVFEHCDDFEQGLRLDASDGLPPGGVLDWITRSTPGAIALFRSRAAARAAIRRTDHYRQAFGTQHPERRFCAVVPVRFVDEQP